MQINLILQGKGGVGKSFCASLLTQHFIARGLTPLCIDTDPVNATFAGYGAYNVQRVDIMRDGDIDPRAFDQLVELLLNTDDPAGVAVIDNGAATFVPLCAYLAANEVLAMLAEAGHQVRLHTVLTGGQALDDTVQGFVSLATNFSAANLDIVVWQNEFFGPLARDGYRFEQSALYAAHARRIHALITLPAVRKEFANALEQMLSARHTFAEVATNPDYDLMTRQRLRIVWRTLAAQMERAML